MKKQKSSSKENNSQKKSKFSQKTLDTQRDLENRFGKLNAKSNA